MLDQRLNCGVEVTFSVTVDGATQDRQRGLSLLFLMLGVLMGSSLSRTPAIRDGVGASTSEMGLIFFGMSTGAVFGILLSGRLTERLGPKPVILIGTISALLCMPAIAAALSAGPGAGSRLLAAGALSLFGFGFGVAEVAVTLEAMAVELATVRPFLPKMHGFFSLGACVGAGAGIICAATRTGASPHLLVVGAVAIVFDAAALSRLPSVGVPRVVKSRAAEPSTQRAPSTLDGRLVIMGVVAFAMALTEGAANDWMPLLMVDGHGLDPAAGSMVYAFFCAIMAVGRFVGNHVAHRVGPTNFFIGTAALGACGIALVAAVNNIVVVSIAVLMWGLGVASGFPLALSVVGSSGPNARARISVTATIGYLALLVGPPLLGFMGQYVGLRSALVVPFFLMIVVIVAAGLVRRAEDASPAASTPT